MLASERLTLQREKLDAEIVDLLRILYDAEDGLGHAGMRLGWFRTLRVRLLVRGLRSRLRNLRGQRILVDTCYKEARAYEGWLEPNTRNRQKETTTL